MVKILSRAGSSLADIYDVKGSIAGIDQLETRELPIVHEMGSTVFSERLSGFIRRSISASTAQNTAFDVVITDLPAGIYKIQRLAVLADNTAARTDNIQVSVRATNGGREVPIFVWNSTDNSQDVVRIVENAGVAGDEAYFNPLLPFVPILCINDPQRQVVGDEIVMRGTTSGFGAGTLAYTLLVYLAFTHVGGISSVGLPIPSW